MESSHSNMSGGDGRSRHRKSSGQRPPAVPHLNSKTCTEQAPSLLMPTTSLAAKLEAELQQLQHNLKQEQQDWHTKLLEELQHDVKLQHEETKWRQQKKHQPEEYNRSREERRKWQREWLRLKNFYTDRYKKWQSSQEKQYRRQMYLVEQLRFLKSKSERSEHQHQSTRNASSSSLRSRNEFQRSSKDKMPSYCSEVSSCHTSIAGERTKPCFRANTCSEAQAVLSDHLTVTPQVTEREIARQVTAQRSSTVGALPKSVRKHAGTSMAATVHSSSAASQVARSSGYTIPGKVAEGAGSNALVYPEAKTHLSGCQALKSSLLAPAVNGHQVMRKTLAPVFLDRQQTPPETNVLDGRSSKQPDYISQGLSSATSPHLTRQMTFDALQGKSGNLEDVGLVTQPNARATAPVTDFPVTEPISQRPLPTCKHLKTEMIHQSLKTSPSGSACTEMTRPPSEISADQPLKDIGSDPHTATCVNFLSFPSSCLVENDRGPHLGESSTGLRGTTPMHRMRPPDLYGVISHVSPADAAAEGLQFGSKVFNSSASQTGHQHRQLGMKSGRLPEFEKPSWQNGLVEAAVNGARHQQLETIVRLPQTMPSSVIKEIGKDHRPISSHTILPEAVGSRCQSTAPHCSHSIISQPREVVKLPVSSEDVIAESLGINSWVVISLASQTEQPHLSTGRNHLDNGQHEAAVSVSRHQSLETVVRLPQTMPLVQRSSVINLVENDHLPVSSIIMFPEAVGTKRQKVTREGTHVTVTDDASDVFSDKHLSDSNMAPMTSPRPPPAPDISSLSVYQFENRLRSRIPATTNILPFVEPVDVGRPESAEGMTFSSLGPACVSDEDSTTPKVCSSAVGELQSVAAVAGRPLIYMTKEQTTGNPQAQSSRRSTTSGKWTKRNQPTSPDGNGVLNGNWTSNRSQVALHSEYIPEKTEMQLLLSLNGVGPTTDSLTIPGPSRWIHPRIHSGESVVRNFYKLKLPYHIDVWEPGEPFPIGGPTAKAEESMTNLIQQVDFLEEADVLTHGGLWKTEKPSVLGQLQPSTMRQDGLSPLVANSTALIGFVTPDRSSERTDFNDAECLNITLRIISSRCPKGIGQR